jgi:hypothetical protein
MKRRLLVANAVGWVRVRFLAGRIELVIIVNSHSQLLYCAGGCIAACAEKRTLLILPDFSLSARDAHVSMLQTRPRGPRSPRCEVSVR